MKADPLYDEVPPRLRALSESELAAEERLALESLSQVALRHLDEPNTEDPESLSAELRLLEIQLALNLKVRDSTFDAEIAKSRSKGEVTPQVEEAMRSLVNGTFEKEIDRLQFQLTRCREKLALLGVDSEGSSRSASS